MPPSPQHLHQTHTSQFVRELLQRLELTPRGEEGDLFSLSQLV